MERVTQTPADALVGRVFGGRYRLIERLGGGAMGTVYKALDAAGQPCAIKVMQAEAVADDSLRERFEREAKALILLRHPNILEVREHGVEGGLPFIVMELLQGRTLEEMVVEHTPDPQTGFELAKQVMRGLAHAHSHGVLHRDLKTENVFVTWDGQAWRAKLLDFGLVKFVDDEKWGSGKKLTMQGAVFGSPAYMSPEQATGAPMDARADVYSAGVVLYELLSGAWPFEAETQMEMLKLHLVGEVPPLASKREGLAVRPELDAIVKRALAKKASDRFANAGELLAALESVPQPAAWIAGMTNVPAQPLAPAPVSPALVSPALVSPAAPPAPMMTAPPEKQGGGVPWLLVAGVGAVGVLAIAATLIAFVLLR